MDEGQGGICSRNTCVVIQVQEVRTEIWRIVGKKDKGEQVFEGNDIPSSTHKHGVRSADSQTNVCCREAANEYCVICRVLVVGLTQFHMPETENVDAA